MKTIKIAVTFVFILSLVACEKNIHTIEGTNSVVYRRDYGDHYKIEMAPMVQKETFIIGEVDVYKDVMGHVAQDASGSSINGKPYWIKDITIRDLKLSEHIQIGLTDDNSNLNSNLVNCQLLYTYYPADNSGEKKVLLANFVEYNASAKRAIMQTTGQDLTSLFAEQHASGSLRLVFQFGQTPHNVGKMRLWYTIPFSYAYTYSYMESKK